MCEVGLFVCQLASQAISLPVYGNMHVPSSHTLLRGKVWAFGRHCRMENWHLWLCAFQTNPFCLYLLTSIPKRQLEGLALVTHATVDGRAVLVYVIILLGAKIIQAMLHIVTMQRLADAFHKYHGRLQAFSIKAILYDA